MLSRYLEWKLEAPRWHKGKQVAQDEGSKQKIDGEIVEKRLFRLNSSSLRIFMRFLRNQRTPQVLKAKLLRRSTSSGPIISVGFRASQQASDTFRNNYVGEYHI